MNRQQIPLPEPLDHIMYSDIPLRGFIPIKIKVPYHGGPWYPYNNTTYWIRYKSYKEILQNRIYKLHGYE